MHIDTKNMLLANEAFEYAHLIKFERPSRTDSGSGLPSTSAQRYTYICDASRDVEFDDGSVDNNGTPNGSQTYRANKVLKVSSMSEDTQAKASTYSITLDGNGLGAFAAGLGSIVEVTSDIYDVTLPTTQNLIREGFREGDKIVLRLDQTTIVVANIINFRSSNIIRVKTIDSNLPIFSGDIEIALASEEIVSILLNKNSDDYASFINREVFVYRAYFKNGTIVGNPILIFKGIISGVNFEDSEALTVTWNMTSHWGDFSQVRGRITSDDYHRALDQNGIPQPQSALKVAYAYDKGFSHAETSINILAQYSVKVEKQDIQVKKGFLGIGSKVKVKKYFVDEIRNSQLDFQLQAKSIPIIYGVRNTEGIPFFADTLNNDSSTVFVGEVLSEGEIGGIYDIYIEGNSLICNDKADFDARSVQTNDETVKLICRGRADRGDVLGGTISTVPTYNDYYDYYSFEPGTVYQYRLPYDLSYLNRYPTYVEPVTTIANTTGAGIVDGESITLTSPQKIVFDVFSGKPGQKAAASLVSIAKANNFKIQNDYWNGTDSADYWSPNHRLLDTAYIIGKYKIEEGETTIPTTTYIVRGKVVKCYNYDKSYNHDANASSENPDNFELGDFVQLRKMDGTVINTSVQIIDKWSFANANGTKNTRFRFSIDPSLGYINGIPTTTKFQMIKDANTWTMHTFNHKEIEGTVPIEWISTVTGAVNNNGFVQFNFNNVSAQNPDPSETSSAYGIVDANGFSISNTYFAYAALIGDASATSLKTKYSWAFAGAAATNVIGQNIVKRNVITLPNSASTVDGYYEGYEITLTRLNSVTGKLNTQTRTIIAYSGSSKLATIDGLWDFGFHPKVGDKIYLTPPYADHRVTTNTALQLMDYICSRTYGRGLDPFKDLNFSSWLESARICDEQSNVTVQVSNGIIPTSGHRYRYPQTGSLIWQGSVVGSDNSYTEFTDVIGKLTNKWNNWKNYKLNELIYNNNNLYIVTAPGVKTTEPTHTAGVVNGLTRVTSITLYKDGINNPATNLILSGDGNPVKALKNGTIIPGYSLYDCDGVDYWRMLGWDEFNQRYVTRHQTNMIVDTSIPLLDNVNSFLEHFGGILRYSGGQYYLEVEQPANAISNLPSEVRNITADEIIGKIRLVDEGIRSSFNSLTASYSDPANKFESRNIGFFNSDYLKIDRNVPKKGSITVPGITNYYNTRMIVDKFLNKSRFGLTISFSMRPSGVLLLSGKIIQIQYPKYNWEDKKFRIINLTHQSDTTVDIVAEEYDDSFYGLSKISKQAAIGLAGGTAVITSIDPPTELRASSIDTGDETYSGVDISWVNNPIATPKNMYTELYSSYSPHLFVEVSSINSNILTTVQTDHGLKVGELITPSLNIAGLQADRAYFVKNIVASNAFTISESKDGPIKALTNTSGISLLMLTANLLATIDIPGNSYIDVFGGINGRVIKYYWVRHKVIQGN